MAKSAKSHVQIIALVAVLLIAVFLRLYRISELTEFLGDQGRTGIHIYEAWKNNTLPLVGPTVLSGQHLGPAFYYLIVPSFVLTGFNPVVPAVFTALLGVGAVGLLWWLAHMLFGWQIATMLAALWAVSPQIVSSDRVLWEPNLLPFFVLLYLVALYKVRNDSRFVWGVISGASLGILVQLHYPNFLFIALTFIFYCAVWRERKNKHLSLLRTSIGTVSGFILVLLPFLIYESSHGFEDITGVMENFFAGGGMPLAKRQILSNLLDYSSRVVRRVVRFPSGWEGVFLSTYIAVSLVRKNFWKSFIALWFFVGLGAISFYKGVVFDHYLFFLLPAPFLLFGYPLKWLEEKGMTWLSIALIALFFLSNVRYLDINKPGVNDISRARAVVGEIMTETANQPFSFGLIASRSFSDTHYRYFFLTQGYSPEPILADVYQKIFLVCETDICLTSDQLIKQSKAQIICFDDHCEWEYPQFDLTRWKFDKSVEIHGARIYVFER